MDEELENKLESIEDLEAEALKELETLRNGESKSEEEEEEEQEDNDSDDKEEKESEDDNDEDEKEEDKEDDKTSTFKPVEIEIAGQKIVLNSEEELKEMLAKGAESISKQDNSLGLEKEIIKQGKLTAEDLKLLIDARNGDAKALARLAKISNIDILEVEADDADKYVPQFAPQIVSDVERVAQRISQDTEHAEVFTRIASGLPLEFKTAIMSNAGDLETFSNHVRSGLAQQIIPEAMKLVYTKGISFNDAYVKVGIELTSKKDETPETQDRTLTDREKELRKKASEQGNDKGNSGSKKTLTADDIANMSDEDFEKLTANDLK